jgi:hypothetical protein
MPGERFDLNKVVRLEAHGEQSGAMELALLDNGVERPGGEKNRMVYFDMKRKGRGESPNVSVSPHNALYEVLQFPLLFEKGKGGFYLSSNREGGVRSTTDIKLSLQEYTRSMLYQNPRLHCLGRLAQEYALVQHSRHVENMLNYQRFNLQAKLQRRRRDVGGGEEGDGARMAMSSSVPGSIKYNQGLIEDSCAVSAQMGQGSLFITMTCNPHWPEITAALEPGQSWEDRPDVVNRVFKLKLQELLEDLRQGKLYKRQDGSPWKTKYIMYVVEFQKRGKPHAHITIRFEGGEADMPRSAEAVDSLISARVPKVVNCQCSGEGVCKEHRLLNAVQKHMMHRCGVPYCLDKDGPRVCRRRFPKAQCEETTKDDGGYPIYCRGVGDEFVVPYSPALLLKYDCHINVELCTSVWVIK